MHISLDPLNKTKLAYNHQVSSLQSGELGHLVIFWNLFFKK